MESLATDLLQRSKVDVARARTNEEMRAGAVKLIEALVGSGATLEVRRTGMCFVRVRQGRPIVAAANNSYQRCRLQ